MYARYSLVRLGGDAVQMGSNNLEHCWQAVPVLIVVNPLWTKIVGFLVDRRDIFFIEKLYEIE